MPLADVERVIYKNNPLVEVVCQLRFPRILTINEIVPVGFQESIRREYPLFNVSVEQQQQLTLDIENPLPPRMVQIEASNNYEFSSADNMWRVNLTSTFLSLSTNRYTCWEEFSVKLQNPVQALLDIYEPAFYERIGLRYVDVFTKSKLGLGGANWSELIHPFALGFLSNDALKDEIINYNSVVEIDIGNTSLAQIRTSLGAVDIVGAFNPFLQSSPTELSLIVDSDMFCFRRSLDELVESLEHLHGVSTKLIRSIIKNKLHDAMEPDII